MSTNNRPWNFLIKFAELLEKTEVPPRFTIWCGIGALLAVMERRVWVNQGIFEVYPNFYIVLIAGSGQKKSTPIVYVDKLLRKLQPLGPNVLAQKVSTEALISSLKRCQVAVPGTKIVKESSGGIVIADELTTFLDRGTIERGMMPTLTKLYDCSPFEYQTLKRGTETVENGYLSILGGSTVELIRSALPRDSIGSGLTSRMLFIYEDRLSPPVAWIDFDEKSQRIEAELVGYLRKLLDLSGPINFSTDARKFFEADYNDRYYISPFRHDPCLAGYENRRDKHLMKIAVAIMLAESPSLTMELRHIQGAKVILEEAEEFMPKVVDLIMASEAGAQNNMVYSFIASRKEVSRSDLVRHFSSRLDAAEISKITDTLVIAKKIDLRTVGSKLVYVVKTSGDTP